MSRIPPCWNHIRVENLVDGLANGLFVGALCQVDVQHFLVHV